MNQIIAENMAAGILLVAGGYGVGLFLNRKLKHPVFNPLLIAILVVSIILVLTDTAPSSLKAGTAPLTALLTPATVCLAIPLSKQMTLLKKNYKAILGGCLAGVLASLMGIFGLSLLFGLPYADHMGLLPKSVTTAIGIGIAEELGGNTTLTIAAIIITGITGNVFAELICKIFGIRSPIAKGVAIGTSAHAIGTTKAMEIGEIEGAVSSLALIIAGLSTVVLAPLLVKITFHL